MSGTVYEKVQNYYIIEAREFHVNLIYLCLNVGVTEVTSVFHIPDFGSPHSQFITFPSMVNLLCSVLDNWQRGDAILIGGEEAAAYFTGTVQVIL